MSSLIGKSFDFILFILVFVQGSHIGRPGGCPVLSGTPRKGDCTVLASGSFIPGIISIYPHMPITGSLSDESLKVSVTTEPIWLYFTAKLFLGLGKVNNLTLRKFSPHS